MNAQAICRRMPLLGAAFVALDGTQIFAQEALAESVVVERSRKARKEAIDQNQYRFKAGPVLMRLDAIMGFEFNDNPNLLEDGDDADFAFYPQLELATLWPINKLNALSFNLGVGYRKYIDHTELDQLVITPNSELSVDIYTGDFIINVHERVSYTQNPVQDPSVSGTGDFGGIENTAGVQADWDLNDVLVTAGYDHFNFISTGSPLSDVQERSSEIFFARTGLQLGRGLRAGLEVGGGLTDYKREVFADNTEFTVGPFAELELSPQLRMRLSGGWVRYDFDQPAGDLSITNVVPNIPDSVSDFYAGFTVDHQISKFMSHRLSLGREARAGAASELMTLWYARYGNDWSVSKYVTLQGQVFYEDGKDRAGFTTEKFWRVGAGLGLTIPLSRQLSTGGGYQLIYKDSDEQDQGYLQNLVTVEFRYAF